MSSESGVRDELTIGPPGSQYSMSPAEGPADPSAELTYQYGLEVEARSQWAYARRRFFRHRLALGSLIVLLLIFGAGVFANFLAPYSYTQINLDALSAKPSAHHLFGTDSAGRDSLSRVLYGIRTSARVGVLVGVLSTLIGTIIGGLAGFYGGWLDNLLMRVTDLFLAVPLLVVLILMTRLPNYQPWAKTVFGETGSLRSVVTILSLFFWMPMARIVRGQVLSLKEKEFVEAARAVGASDTRILLRHLIPN